MHIEISTTRGIRNIYDINICAFWQRDNLPALLLPLLAPAAVAAAAAVVVVIICA